MTMSDFKPIASITPRANLWENGTWKFALPKITAGTAPSYQDIIISGTVSVTLTNALANGLNYLKLFGGTEQVPETYLDTVTLGGGCEQRNLPSEYTQVEYLESSGTQYIDTGINGTQITRFVVKGTCAPTVNGNNSQLLGGTNNSAYTFFGCRVTNGTPYWYCRDASGGLGDPSHLSIIDCTINSTTSQTGTLTDTVTGTTEEFISLASSDWGFLNENLLLFGGDSTRCSTDATCYELQLYTSSGLVRDFIPARRNSDNVLGMYDTVTGNFLTNAGTGTFTAGSDTVPTPDTPMDIVCNNGILKVSPNLFNKNLVPDANEYINRSTGVTSTPSSGEFRHSDYITIKENTQYYVGIINSAAGSAGLAFYDGTKTFISGISLNELSNSNNIITSPADTKYIRFSFRTDEGYNTNWQNTVYFVEGNQPLAEFMPYGQIYTDGTVEQVTDSLGNTASAERLLAVGDYKDTQEVLSGSVTKQIGITILDGTEGWIKSGTYAGSFYTNVYNPLDGAKVANISNVYCTHGFKVDSLVEYASAPIGAFYWYSSGTINYKYDDGTATVEQFKQWLADQYANGTPVIIAYPLATATTESVSGQFLSKSPVTQTAGSISNLPIAITESSHTTPTPTQPLQINCNNGVIKLTPNLLDRSKETQGVYINKATGNIDTTASPWAVSDYIPVTAESKITISGITFSSVSAGYNYYNSQKTLVSTISYETGTHTYTVPNNASYIRICYRYEPDDNVRINVGDSANNIYTDGTTETVEVTGKNLFDYEYFYDNYQNYGTSAVGRCLIQLKPNTAYTISTNKNSSLGNSVMFVVSGSAIDWTPSTTGNGILAESPRTVTTDSNGYLCFGIYVESENAIPESDFINGTVWAQLELGSTATTYEPYYNGGSATAEMLLKVGDYKDVQSILDGGVTRRIGVKALDGSESWMYYSVTQGNMFRVQIAESVSDNKDTLGVLCNSYKIVSTNNRTNDTLSGTSKNYDFINNNYTTLDSWKAYLADQYNAGTPVIVVYPLAEPTTETVTAQPLTTQAGTNIVQITQASIDNLELEVSYKGEL